MILQLIKTALQQFINDIDARNTNISESEQEELLKYIQKLSDKELSKTEASRYIKVCTSTFDNYIRKGLIPKGRKVAGFNELRWMKSDLDKFLNKNVQ